MNLVAFLMRGIAVLAFISFLSCESDQRPGGGAGSNGALMDNSNPTTDQNDDVTGEVDERVDETGGKSVDNTGDETTTDGGTPGEEPGQDDEETVTTDPNTPADANDGNDVTPIPPSEPAHLHGKSFQQVGEAYTVTGSPVTNGVLFDVKNEDQHQFLLELRGTNAQMGFAHGYLLAESIVEIWHSAKDAFDWNGRVVQAPPRIPITEVYKGIPFRFQQEMEGMAAGINQKLEELGKTESERAELAIDKYKILFLQMEVELAGMGCTGLLSKGQHTLDQQTFVSRTVDWSDRDPAKVWVRNQGIITYLTTDANGLEMRPKLVSLSRSGIVGAYTAFNENGFYSEMNYSSPAVAPVDKSNGMIYPQLLMMRDFVETVTDTNVTDVQIEEQMTQFFSKWHRTQTLKNVHASQFLVVADHPQRSQSYASVIEGMGVHHEDVQFRRPGWNQRASTTMNYGGFQETVPRPIIPVSWLSNPGGIYVTNGGYLTRLEVQGTNAKFFDAFSGAILFEGVYQNYTNAPAVDLGITLPGFAPSVMGVKIDVTGDASQKLFLSVTQHCVWGPNIVSGTSQAGPVVLRTGNVTGRCAIGIDAQNRFQTSGFWMNSEDNTFGKITLEPNLTTSTDDHGVEITEGRVKLSDTSGTNFSEAGTYTKYGEMLIVGDIAQANGIGWVAYNPRFFDEDLLVNVNNWFLLNSVQFSTQVDTYNATGGGMHRLYNAFRFMAGRNDIDLQAQYDLHKKLYQETAASFVPSLANPLSGVMQLSSVDLRKREMIVGFARVKVDGTGKSMCFDTNDTSRNCANSHTHWYNASADEVADFRYDWQELFRWR